MRRTFIGAGCAAVIAAGSLAGCQQPTEPARQPGSAAVLQLEGFSGAAVAPERDTTVKWTVTPREDDVVAALIAPDTVGVGQPFEVTVRTIGQGGCWSAAGEEVVVKPSGGGSLAGTVEITPLDVHSGEEVCTRILAFLPHTRTLTLPSVGRWVIRVNGVRTRYGTEEVVTPVAAEKTIVVR